MTKSFQGLSEEQFQTIVSLLNWQAPLQRGTPRTDLRRIWNSIFYILIHGVRWDDLPKSNLFAHRATAHRWLKYWQTSVRLKVERSFTWIKRKCRRLLLKWERLAEIWSAMIDLALIYYWLKTLVR